jgi:carboxypeptidase PM20D1
VIKRTLLVLFGVLAAVVAVVLVRASLHRPESGVTVARVTVDVDEATIARHLGDAVKFRTVSHEKAEEFEAQEFSGFIGWVEQTYPEANQAMERVLLGDYTMLYRWPGTDPALQPILLTAHYDVVPVIPGTEDRWTHAPYAGDVADGIVWGRGTLDDKSAVVAQLEAATVLLKTGFRPARTVYFSFGHDEEIGGRNGATNVAKYLAAKNVRLAWSLDEGSFVFDGLLPGVKPLTAAVNVAEKGYLTLDIVAKGAGGHSSMPPQHTAVGTLARAISQLEEHPMPGGLTGLSGQMFDTISRYMPFGYRVLFANRWLFDGVIEKQLSATTFGNAMLRTTTAPTMLSGSVAANVLPIEAIATVNFRLHPRDTVDDVVKHVKSSVDDENIEVRVDPAGGAASAVSDWNSAGFGAIAQSIREIYGDVIVTPGLMIAGSDSRHYGEVSDNAFRFNPMIVTQDDLTGFHGTNEKIGVQTLAQGVRTYVQIIRNGASR